MPTPTRQPASDPLQADADALQQVMLRVSQLSRRSLTATLTASGLTVPQYMTLVVLWRARGGCTMSDLADSTHQVGATMTGIIDRLIERGLVERWADPADRRSRRVTLTEAGTRLMRQIDTARRDQMQALLSHFLPEERQDLLRLMERYATALEALLLTDTPRTL